MHAIQFKNPKALPGLYSPRLAEFISAMLSKAPARRPSIFELF